MKVSYYLIVVLSHRPVDYGRCGLNFLSKRFSVPGRLSKIPLFNDLEPLSNGHTSYGSRLNIYQVDITDNNLNCSLVKSYNCDRKIQHACLQGEKLIVCFEDCVEVWRNWARHSVPEGISRIDDNWFAGLHTVFSMGQSACVVSSSAADAVMTISVDDLRVLDRWRLPQSLYEQNYNLTVFDSLKLHYIPNDFQIGHLNCAFPDDEGNVWISTLIQGDIGCLDKNGNFRRVLSGFQGAHGVRRISARDLIYFSDSCLGVLVVASLDGRIVRRHATTSRWMHDAQHLTGDVFLLGLSDLEIIISVDVSTGMERVVLDTRGQGYIQFLNIAEHNVVAS